MKYYHVCIYKWVRLSYAFGGGIRLSWIYQSKVIILVAAAYRFVSLDESLFD
jgi:hypothetical protein